MIQLVPLALNILSKVCLLILRPSILFYDLLAHNGEIFQVAFPHNPIIILVSVSSCIPMKGLSPPILLTFTMSLGGIFDKPLPSEIFSESHVIPCRKCLILTHLPPFLVSTRGGEANSGLSHSLGLKSFNLALR